MKIILLTFFFLFSFGTYAHQDIVTSVNKENIHFEYITGWTTQEIGQKVDIFLELATILVKEKGYINDQIYIYFNHDYTKCDSSYFILGFEQFSYLEYINEEFTKSISATGLKLMIRDRDFNIKEILNIISSAISNVHFIKTNQQQLIINKHYYKKAASQANILYSISPAQIRKYISFSDTTVERLVSAKTYRNLKKTEKIRDIDYYYQNNQFHFYNTRKPDFKWSEEQNKYVISNTYGEDILVVDNILEIFGNFNDGHFVFVNDSIFYYIPQLKDKVSGPFKVDSVIAGRPPILKYYHEYSPINRFTLFIYNYSNYNKAIFFPDSNLVISNFEKLENKFINSILNNNESFKQHDTDSNIKQLLILFLLFLSIGLNVWLLSIKRK